MWKLLLRGYIFSVDSLNLVVSVWKRHIIISLESFVASSVDIKPFPLVVSVLFGTEIGVEVHLPGRLRLSLLWYRVRIVHIDMRVSMDEAGSGIANLHPVGIRNLKSYFSYIDVLRQAICGFSIVLQHFEPQVRSRLWSGGVFAPPRLHSVCHDEIFLNIVIAITWNDIYLMHFHVMSIEVLWKQHEKCFPTGCKN